MVWEILILRLRLIRHWTVLNPNQLENLPILYPLPQLLNDVEDKVTEYYVILMNALVNQLHVFYREVGDDRLTSPNK